MTDKTEIRVLAERKQGSRLRGKYGVVRTRVCAGPSRSNPTLVDLYTEMWDQDRNRWYFVSELPRRDNLSPSDDLVRIAEEMLYYKPRTSGYEQRYSGHGHEGWTGISR